MKLISKQEFEQRNILYFKQINISMRSICAVIECIQNKFSHSKTAHISARSVDLSVLLINNCTICILPFWNGARQKKFGIESFVHCAGKRRESFVHYDQTVHNCI